MDLRKIVFNQYTFVSTSLILSLGVSITPSILPLILLLANLLVYSRILFLRCNALPHTLLLLVTLTLGVSLAHITPSVAALSSPGQSIAAISALSLLTSSIAILTVFLDTRLCMRWGSTWSSLTFFPALWATTWWMVSDVSTVGRLAAWSPLINGTCYGWILPYTGPTGADFIVAAWAVVISQIISGWYMGEPSENDHETSFLGDSVHEASISKSSNTRRSISSLAVLLLTLSLPYFFLTNLPTPAHSENTTPLIVGCVLPYAHHPQHPPSLDDFIEETKKMKDANLLLWPEGAVVFESPGARDEGLEKIAKEIPGRYVGVGFEEFTYDNATHSSQKRTGLALIYYSNLKDKRELETKLMYYKRHLVPIAESFSLTHSEDPPQMVTLHLPPPSGVTKPDWGPGGKRPIDVTASICLDFAYPDLFADLPSRPSLILAPARTWHTAIGTAMWEQARSRADELGSMVLWCDGGAGGVSGVGGRGLSGIGQVGPGSWMRTVGLEYPINDRKTVYARGGDFSVVLGLWALSLGGVGFSAGRNRIRRGSTSLNLVAWLRDRTGRRETQPPLIDY